MIYNIRAFGALGNEGIDDTSAVQAAVDACHAAGGGQVRVPGGAQYRITTITLKSGVELYLEAAAALVAAPDYALRQPVALIRAQNADQIALTGQGLIDGGGQQFVKARPPYKYQMEEPRPNTFLFVGCSNITLRDLTLRDSAFWCIRLSGCADIVIDHLQIDNDLLLPNGDGIDLDHCRNAAISACQISSGDDCLCFKTAGDLGDFGACENVAVTDCTLISNSCAIKLGSESRAPLRNMTFDHCQIQSSHRGLGIQLRDEGDVENIVFSNITVETRLFHPDWWGAAEPIYVTALPRTAQTALGAIRHVRFSNIECHGENGAFIAGSSPDHIEDITLENVRIELVKSTEWEGGRVDLRPPVSIGLSQQPSSGFFIRNARNVTVRDCRVTWGQECPNYFGCALDAINVNDLQLENFQGEAAHPDKDPAIRQR